MTGSLGCDVRITAPTKGKLMLTRLTLSFCLTMSLVGTVSADTSLSRRETIEMGRSLAQTHCAACHAIGKRGESPNSNAPRFRTLGQRYPLENLAEAFSEGIVVGHGPMPEFQFEPEQIDGLVAYLKSVQSPTKRTKKRREK